MKNLPVVCFLILITTQVVYSYPFQSLFLDIIFDFFDIIRKEFFYDECPGVCLPVMLTFMCPTTNRKASCSERLFTAKCCAFTPLLDGDVETTTVKLLTSVHQNTQPALDKIDSPTLYLDENVTKGPGIISTTSIEPGILHNTEFFHDETIDQKRFSTEQTTRITNTNAPQKEASSKCEGECLEGQFALFCDNIDGVASCPSRQICCIKTNVTGANSISLDNLTPTTGLSTDAAPEIVTESYKDNTIDANDDRRPEVLMGIS